MNESYFLTHFIRFAAHQKKRSKYKCETLFGGLHTQKKIRIPISGVRK